MKNLSLSLILLLSLSAPANAISQRSIITFSNSAQKCERNYLDFDDNFSFIERWWDRVEQTTIKNKDSKPHLSGFVKISKAYCKALKQFQSDFRSGKRVYDIKMDMINFTSDIDRARLDQDIRF